MKAPRELPNDLGAETSVIGSLLIENAGFDQISSQLEPGQCFRDAHRKILTVIYDLLGAGKPADLRTVATELKRRKLPNGDHWLEDTGGPAYLASLVDGVPRSTNIRAYAAIVREKAALRRLHDAGTKIATRALANDAEARDVLSGAEIALADVATMAQIQTGTVPLSADLSALTADLEQRIAHRGQLSGLPTGFPELDLLTHGWQRRQMVVIAGQTSFGKSIFALNTAKAIAQSGQRVAYYSYEMSRQELQYRLLSDLAEIPLTRILWGNLGQTEYAKLSNAMDVMHGLPLEINDGDSRSIADVRAECRQIKADRGLAAVVLDHFQLMDGVDGENRTQQLGGVSRGIQRLAGELDVTTFALSQLTLSGAEANQEPQLDHLRECKQLGHDAHVVLMLHPQKPSEARKDTPVVLFKLLCRKQRGGRLGTIWLDMERDYVRFVAGSEPRPEPKAEKKKTEPTPEAIRY